MDELFALRNFTKGFVVEGSTAAQKYDRTEGRTRLTTRCAYTRPKPAGSRVRYP